MSHRPVIHLGAYATGTNWLNNSLVQSGLKPQTRFESRNFFKHYVIENDTLDILEPPDNAIYVCIIKSPLFWFKSVKRMIEAGIMPAPTLASLRGSTLSEIIRAPGYMAGCRREVMPEDQARVHYDSLPDFWNQYASGYLNHLPAGNLVVIRYEEAIEHPERIIQQILETANSSPSEIHIHKDSRFASKTTEGVGRDLEQARAYYLDDSNRAKEYSDTDLEFIQNQINPNLLGRLGYGLEVLT